MARSVRRFERLEWSETVRFDRPEIRLLFNLYSRRVVSGAWRDYALDGDRARAIFSVFRHSRSEALYAIEKLAGDGGFRLWSRGRRLTEAATLSEIVRALDARPHLVGATV